MRPFVVTYKGPAWQDSFVPALLHPDKLICRPDTWMLQTSDRTMVALVRVDDVPLVTKLYFRANLVDRMESLFLGVRAARVPKNMERMRQAGFETPELVAVLAEPPTMTLGRSCVVTLPVAGGIRLDELWRSAGPANRLRIARTLGGYFRDLHQRGLYPQDTRVQNFLAVPERDTWRLVLVDLDRVRAYRHLSWRRRLKNLVQIARSGGENVRRTERLTFLITYLGSVDRNTIKRYAREIDAASQRKVR